MNGLLNFQTEPYNAVGFGERLIVTRDNYSANLLDSAKVSCFAANKGGTTVPRPFWIEGLFCIPLMNKLNI